jgi:hypothetical protein
MPQAYELVARDATSFWRNSSPARVGGASWITQDTPSYDQLRSHTPGYAQLRLVTPGLPFSHGLKSQVQVLLRPPSNGDQLFVRYAARPTLFEGALLRY